MTVEAGVYLHVKPNTRQVYYVGYTSNINGKRPNDIWSRNSYWNNVYNKYGIEVVLLFKGTKEKALNLEMQLISIIGIDKLTNITIGGECGVLGLKHTEESKRKMSKGHKGIIVSEKTRLKMSESHIGKNTWSKVFKVSDKTKRKISESNKGRYVKGKAVLQYTKDNKFIAEYVSIMGASRVLKIDHANIVTTCKGVRKTAGGFKWEYKN